MDGPGIGSSGEGGAGDSRGGGDGGGSGFEGREVVKAEGKGADAKSVLVFVEVEGGIGGGTTSMIRPGFDDVFCC